ncbi:hypothetical protein J3E69DRAFT_333776 [Trichoderma sp. SZMC 28015]
MNATRQCHLPSSHRTGKLLPKRKKRITDHLHRNRGVPHQMGKTKRGREVTDSATSCFGVLPLTGQMSVAVRYSACLSTLTDVAVAGEEKNHVLSVATG